MPFIKLLTSDNEKINLDTQIAERSNTIRSMIRDLDSEEEDDPILLDRVNAATLRKVIDWCTYFRDDSGIELKNEKNRKREDSAWVTEYFKVDCKVLIDLVLATNYLGVEDLYEATCKVISNFLSKKSVEEIRKEFNIKNDFTPDEERQIQQECEWLKQCY